MKTKQAKFGSKEFFLDYMSNQIEKEDAPRQEVIYRVHFSMTQFIFETFTGKQAIGYIRNLAQAGEELSEWKKVRSYL
jgi:hypothetical protein